MGFIILHTPESESPSQTVSDRSPTHNRSSSPLWKIHQFSTGVPGYKSEVSDNKPALRYDFRRIE